MKPEFQSAGRWALLLVLIAIPLASGAEDLATLRGDITDAVTGQPTPCTVTITDAHGKTVQESAAFSAGFRSNGQFEKLLLWE